MAKSLVGLITEVLLRLGDTEAKVWTSAGIQSYLKEGYDRLAISTGCFWDTAYLKDVAGTATHTVPTDLYEIERATSDNMRANPLTSSELRNMDSRYETTQGPVDAYSMQMDGLRTLRKWRVPSGNADTYAVTGTWGLLRRPADLSSESVTGTWGIPRRIPGMHLMGSTGGWGLPREPFKELRSLRIEYRRRGRPVTFYENFELPDRYVKYVRHFAMWKALEQDGPGQDMELAAHYQARFELGVERVKRRMNVINVQREVRLGGASTPRRTPPRPQLPWAYGRYVRFR